MTDLLRLLAFLHGSAWDDETRGMQSRAFKEVQEFISTLHETKAAALIYSIDRANVFPVGSEAYTAYLRVAIVETELLGA